VVTHDGRNPKQKVSGKIAILQTDGVHNPTHFYKKILRIITRRGVVMVERIKLPIYYLQQVFISSDRRKHLPNFLEMLAIKTKEIKSLPQALPILMCLGTTNSSKHGGSKSVAPSSDCEYIIIEFLTLSIINLSSCAQTVPLPKNIYVFVFGDFRVFATDFAECS
jgi:hypothetical protein